MSDDEKCAGGEKRKKWFPLESNPTIMTKFVGKLGFPTAAYEFTDVYSTEDWAMAMVPQPVIAVLMLFPIKESTEVHRKAEAERIKAQGQVVSESVYFMKQTVGNACGTVGLLHATFNAALAGKIELEKDSFLSRFLERTRSMAPADIAKALHDDDEIEAIHGSAAAEGQSNQIEMSQSVETHFVCLSLVDDHVYELDGRKETPVNHGPSTAESFLADACNVVKGFMAKDPEELRFTIVALAPPADEDA